MNKNSLKNKCFDITPIEMFTKIKRFTRHGQTLSFAVNILFR